MHTPARRSCSHLQLRLLASTPLSHHHERAAVKFSIRGLSRPPVQQPQGAVSLRYTYSSHNGSAILWPAVPKGDRLPVHEGQLLHWLMTAVVLVLTLCVNVDMPVHTVVHPCTLQRVSCMWTCPGCEPVLLLGFVCACTALPARAVPTNPHQACNPRLVTALGMS